MKDKLLTIGVVIFVLFVLWCWLFLQPTMEARTFNKFTDGEKATVIDALFANLRVEACK